MSPPPAGRGAGRLASSVLLGVALLGAAAGGAEAWRRAAEARGNLRIPADAPELKYEYVPGGTENRWGFREREVAREKPPGTLRVAVLGDSVTHGAFVDPELVYARQLERLLASAEGGVPRVEVLNFGVVGYDVSQVAAQLRARVLDFEPDAVVYGAYVNDYVPQEVIGTERGDTFYVGRPVAPEMRLLPGGLDAWLRPRSALFRWAQGAHAARVLAARGDAPAGDWDFFEKHFAHLVYDARSAGVPLVVMGIPPHVLAERDLAACTARAGLGLLYCETNAGYVQHVRALAHATGVPFVDGVAAYRAGDRGAYYGPDGRDAVHPDAAGHALLARALVEPVRAALGSGP